MLYKNVLNFDSIRYESAGSLFKAGRIFSLVCILRLKTRHHVKLKHIIFK